MRTKTLTLLIVTFALFNSLGAQNIWDSNTYPDEAGFTLRMAPMMQRIAGLNYAHRSLSLSRCPDTGLPVSTWALEGETIFSPYTGRAYKQGQVGYFGALERNQQGEIIRFSGDPLKTELPPATAALLLDNSNNKAKAFLSIPGNMRQQYHFACKNWARFYPLLGDVMGEQWKSEFYSWISIYSESRRPSDGDRQFAPMPVPHDLVGEPGHLLGGNKQGGGTENHKTMWRTSGLLYSQLFPDTAYISGYPAKEAENLITEMIRDYLKRLLLTGNGEYDSQVYYPHSIEPFLNLYDFTPDAETKALAKFALDYYFATYGLKTIDGAIAGAQKRGYLPGQNRSEMEIMLWGFFNNTSSDMSNVIAPIHQVTTTYRPNKIIWDIVNKNIPLPYEAKIARPFYHMDNPFSFAETFYCSQSYAMGSIQMTIIDNPNQQMIWSLVAEGTDGPLTFSGGHPMRRSTSGHSPYTQVFQSKGTLLLLTAPTRTPATERFIEEEYARRLNQDPKKTRQSMPGVEREIITRQTNASDPLKPFVAPVSQTAKVIDQFWNDSREMACSWFFYPASLKPVQRDKNWYFEANNTFVAIIPLAGRSTMVAPAKTLVDSLQGPVKSFFSSYHVLAFHDDVSGFVVETGEKSKYGSLDNFARAIRENTRTNLRRLHAEYTTLEGDKMGMQYFPEGLRPLATLNGETQDWENYTNEAVYISPYVSVKEGIMKISNGIDSYTIDFTGELPVYREE